MIERLKFNIEFKTAHQRTLFGLLNFQTALETWGVEEGNSFILHCPTTADVMILVDFLAKNELTHTFSY